MTLLVKYYLFRKKLLNQTIKTQDMKIGNKGVHILCNTQYFIFQRDKVALITGGGTGIGFGITEVLMRYGCNVAIVSRKLEKLEEAKISLQQATNRKCFIAPMDVRKPDTLIRAIEAVLNEYGKIDILVNNAAGNFLAPASSLSFNAFKTVMEIDALGTFNVSKAVFDYYMKDHGGVIVNISATLAYKGTVFQSHASAAKSAIDTLTKCFANEWGQYGIRVVGVAPGPIEDTEGMRRLAGVGSQHRNYSYIPIGRAGQRYEIANSVVFLASSAGSLVTGHTLVADGGAWMTGENNYEKTNERYMEYQMLQKRPQSKI